MTREEAIAILQDKYDCCKSFYDLAAHPEEDYPEMAKYLQALQIALTALRPVSREQVEKIRGEWLNFYNDFSTAECSKCGELFDVSDTNENLKVLFDAFKKYYQFCPSCGAPMTDKAVQMVMDRMEEIYK